MRALWGGERGLERARGGVGVGRFFVHMMERSLDFWLPIIFGVCESKSVSSVVSQSCASSFNSRKRNRNFDTKNPISLSLFHASTHEHPRYSLYTLLRRRHRPTKHNDAPPSFLCAILQLLLPLAFTPSHRRAIFTISIHHHRSGKGRKKQEEKKTQIRSWGDGYKLGDFALTDSGESRERSAKSCCRRSCEKVC